MKDPAAPDEDDLFADAMRDVTPLKHDGVEPHHQKRRPVPRPKRYDEEEEQLADPSDEAPHFFEVRKPGVQLRLFQDFRRGLLPPETTLDLHGMRVIDARAAFLRFLRQSLNAGHKSVRIIHGKGRGSEGAQPVLKQRTYHWLYQRDEVLAFCSAPRWDGGTGATYVLLKRARSLPRRRR